MTVSLILLLSTAIIGCYASWSRRAEGSRTATLFLKADYLKTCAEFSDWKAKAAIATSVLLEDISRPRDMVALLMLALVTVLFELLIQNQPDVWLRAPLLIMDALAPWLVFIELVYRKAELRSILESTPFKAFVTLLLLILAWLGGAMSRQDMNRIFMLDSSHFPMAVRAEMLLKAIGFLALLASLVSFGLKIVVAGITLIKPITFWDITKSLLLIGMWMILFSVSYLNMFRLGFSDFETMFIASVAYEIDMLNTFDCIGSNGKPILATDGWRVLEPDAPGARAVAFRMSSVMQSWVMIEGQDTEKIVKPIAFDYATCTHPVFGPTASAPVRR